MEVWKIVFLSNWVICRFHVNLPGCKKSWLNEDAFFFRLCRGNGMASFWQDRYEEWLEQMGDTPLGHLLPCSALLKTTC